MSNQDCTWINSVLQEFLDSEKSSSYKALIKETLKSDDRAAKYGLYKMFLELSTEKYRVKNLQNRLENLYCEDKDIEKYVNDVVTFNPLLNEVEMNTASGLNIRGDYSFSITVGKPFHDNSDELWQRNAENMVQHAKNYLRIVLTETKKLKTNISE